MHSTLEGWPRRGAAGSSDRSIVTWLPVRSRLVRWRLGVGPSLSFAGLLGAAPKKAAPKRARGAVLSSGTQSPPSMVSHQTRHFSCTRLASHARRRSASVTGPQL